MRFPAPVPITILGLALAAAAALGNGLAAADPGRASTPPASDPGMQLMTAMMRCPALSTDARRVAFYDENPGSVAGARTSLAIYALDGTLEQRVSVVPPARDARAAADAAAKILKILDDGAYTRMARVRLGKTAKTANGFTAHLSADELELDATMSGRTLTLAGTRHGVRLAPLAHVLASGDGGCEGPPAYSIPNTLAGYDPATHILAITVHATAHDTVCFAHEVVVELP